eukprot:3441623-Ditylum_brightwellii.AAC.1
MLPSSDPTWKKLTHDIQYALHDSGSPMILNGSNGGCCRIDFSYCYRMYKSPKEGKKDDSYCKEFLINSGHREDGKYKSKKTMTHMSLTSGQCCPFKVVVKWDNNGFHIDTKCSVSAHKFHPRLSAD